MLETFKPLEFKYKGGRKKYEVLDAKKHPAWGGQAYITQVCTAAACVVVVQNQKKKKNNNPTTRWEKKRVLFFSSSFLARQVNKKVRETAILLSLRQANRGILSPSKLLLPYFYIFFFSFYLVFQPSSSSFLFSFSTLLKCLQGIWRWWRHNRPAEFSFWKTLVTFYFLFFSWGFFSVNVCARNFIYFFRPETIICK